MGPCLKRIKQFHPNSTRKKMTQIHPKAEDAMQDIPIETSTWSYWREHTRWSMLWVVMFLVENILTRYHFVLTKQKTQIV